MSQTQYSVYLIVRCTIGRKIWRGKILVNGAQKSLFKLRPASRFSRVLHTIFFISINFFPPQISHVRYNFMQPDPPSCGKTQSHHYSYTSFVNSALKS